MMFQKVNRSDAEKVFVVVQNVSGSTITAGYSCCFDIGASIDGVRVSKCRSTVLQAFCGVADEDIANNAYGRVQIYGYRSSAYIYSSTGSSVSGDPLVVTENWGLLPIDTTANLFHTSLPSNVVELGIFKSFAFLCEAVAASSSSQYYTTAKVFVRAL